MRPVLLLALAAVALSLGCPPQPQWHGRGCESACGEIPSSRLDGSYRINLLVRSFLRRGELEHARYAFYSYLFFADRGAVTAPARRAAAGAVLQLFSDVGDVAGLPIDHAQLAVLYVPVVSFKATSAIAKRGADQLVAEYDYDRARLLKGQIENATRMTLPRVALLGSSRPLGNTTAIDPAQLYIVDLEHASDVEAEHLLSRFRDALESSYESLSAQVPPASHPALGYFEREGVVLASYHGEN